RTRWIAPGALTVESFEESALHQVRALGMEARLVYLMEHDGTAPDLLGRRDASADDVSSEGAPSYARQRDDDGLAALAHRVDAISVAKRTLFEPGSDGRRTSDLVERARAAGLGTITWTLRPENAFLEPAYRLGEHDAAWGDWQREWQLIAELGLEAVFVDHPDLWRRVTA